MGQRTNRGWFDDSRRYQLLQQSQVPTRLPQVRRCLEMSSRLPCPHGMHLAVWPYHSCRCIQCAQSLPYFCVQVLVISCGMPSGGALPWDAPPDSAGLPWALDIRADPDSWEVCLVQGLLLNISTESICNEPST